MTWTQKASSPTSTRPSTVNAPKLTDPSAATAVADASPSRCTVKDAPGLQVGDEVGAPFLFERPQRIGGQIVRRGRLAARSVEALAAPRRAEHDDERDEEGDRGKEAAHGLPDIGRGTLAMIPWMEIASRVALVTGGGGAGTGRAICLALANAGAKVIVADIDVDGGAETTRRIEAGSGRAAFVQADVTAENDVQRMVGFAEETFGGLDILVNSAGLTPAPHF